MLRSALAAAALVLAGAATPALARPAPVSVTRFHQPDTLARLDPASGRAVSVVAAPGHDPGSLELRAWLEAVAGELPATRLPAATAGAAAILAEVRLDSMVSREPGRRGPVSVGVGGSTGGWHSGFGLGLGFNLGGNRPRPVRQTMLTVILRDRATGQALWEGRAESAVADRGPDADPALLSRRMAHALFTGFPGRSGQTIEVR